MIKLSRNTGRKGATLVELMMTIVIIGIIGAVTASLLISVVRLFITTPAQLKAQQVAEDIMRMITEGDRAMPGTGLKYAVSFSSVGGSSITHDVGYPTLSERRRMMSYLTNYAVYRDYSALGSTSMTTTECYPAYAFPGADSNNYTWVTDGSGAAAIFTFFKNDGTSLSEADANSYPGKIGRIDVTIVVSTGYRPANAVSGTCKMAGSVDIKRYNPQ